MGTYLDHAATTPLLDCAREAMIGALSDTGNASSLHAAGRAARRRVEESRETIAGALGVTPSEVIFTAGGTEADNLAVKGLWWSRTAQDPARRRVLASRIEHHAVLDPVALAGRARGRRGRLARRRRRGPGRCGPAPRRAGGASGSDGARGRHVGQQRGRDRPADRARSPPCAPRRGVPLHVDAVQAVGSIPVDATLPGHDGRLRPQARRPAGSRCAHRAARTRAHAADPRRRAGASGPLRDARCARDRGVRRGSRARAR